MANTQINTAILGASGYTGAELLRLLPQHPHFRIVALSGDSQAGKPVAEVYPHLAHHPFPDLVRMEDVDFTTVQLVFCCLPHGTTQEVIAALPNHVKIVDLSADFRLHNLDSYEEWYGHPHRAPALQQTAIYGLTEHTRNAVKDARLVANPGCYPTCCLLPLVPLTMQDIIDPAAITIHAISGISGAGRSVKQAMLYSEIEGGSSAYGVGAHRHMAEMEEILSDLSGESLHISFTPHLAPFTRGMIATINLQLTGNHTLEDAKEALASTYASEPFVHVQDLAPRTHEVRGTNHARISVHAGRREGEVIVVSVIDNLMKGASGQALQNANIMFDFSEMLGLEAGAVFP
jgi:N-acetyl-gamma-glutamyl-phosphate reductase